MSDNLAKIRELKTLIKRYEYDKISSSAHASKINTYKEKLKELENVEIIEVEIKPIKKSGKKKEIDKLNEEHFKDRPNAILFCPNCDLSEKLYCDMCATEQINQLNKYMPILKHNLKIGRRVKCINPISDLIKNKTYVCGGFGHSRILVRETNQKPTFTKNYQKNRFEVYIRPFGQSGSFCPII